MIITSRNSYPTIEYLTLEESQSIDLPQAVPIIESSLGYIVSYDKVRRLAENYNVDDSDVVNHLSEINHIQDLGVVVEEYEIIDMNYDPNLRYVISPLSESDFEVMYTNACIYLSESYDDDRYLYLLEDLESFDESVVSKVKKWAKDQIQTGKNVMGGLLYGETPQQREIRTGEGSRHELAPAEPPKKKTKREQKIEKKVEEVKGNENGNNAWHSYNPNDRHEEKLQKQNAVTRYYNQKKDDYNQYKASGADSFKAGRLVAKDIGKDAVNFAKTHKKAIGGGIAAAGLGALALSHPNVRKRITALKNRIMGLEEKNKGSQGRFSKLIAKLKAILHKITSKFKGNNRA